MNIDTRSPRFVLRLGDALIEVGGCLYLEFVRLKVVVISVSTYR